MSKSRYDDLHDKYSSILTTKSGTRYERLAAMVFKILEKRSVVIHDLSLIGETDVAHQIDVQVSLENERRHVIVECKDFDVSGDKVGLSIVRNFWSVIEDTKADEGIIITCNGFTSEAAKYAKAKNIKLAVIRAHQEKDWDGFIKKIVLNMSFVQPANPKLDFEFSSEEEKMKFLAGVNTLPSKSKITLSDPIFMVKGSEKTHFNEFLTRHMNRAIPLEDTPIEAKIRIKSGGWMMKFGEHSVVRFEAISVAFDIVNHTVEKSITSDRVAELIISGFGDDDVIIFGDQIERFRINSETREVS